jgi:hypothetical protein
MEEGFGRGDVAEGTSRLTVEPIPSLFILKVQDIV